VLPRSLHLLDDVCAPAVRFFNPLIVLTVSTNICRLITLRTSAARSFILLSKEHVRRAEWGFHRRSDSGARSRYSKLPRLQLQALMTRRTDQPAQVVSFQCRQAHASMLDARASERDTMEEMTITPRILDGTAIAGQIKAEVALRYSNWRRAESPRGWPLFSWATARLADLCPQQSKDLWRVGIFSEMRTPPETITTTRCWRWCRAECPRRHRRDSDSTAATEACRHQAAAGGGVAREGCGRLSSSQRRAIAERATWPCAMYA